MTRLISKSFILFSIISLFLVVVIQPGPISATLPLEGVHGVTLIADDYDPGELDTIDDFLTEYGVEIDYVGPTATVEGEHGTSVETDFLIEEMTNISDYDYMYVPGGFSPENLMEIPAALALVVEAYNAGLVMAAICAGPSLFAEADIISGRNISGNIAIESAVLSAGANFIFTGIVIDGPFVTADYARMFDFAQRGILTALGLFEADPPEIVNCTMEILATGTAGSVSLAVEVFDAFDTQKVIAKFYRYDTDTLEYVLKRQVQLSRNEENTIYSNIIELFIYGNYTLWLEVEDILGNEGIYEDVEKFNLENPNRAGLGLTQISLLLLAVVSLITLVRNRKKNR